MLLEKGGTTERVTVGKHDLRDFERVMLQLAADGLVDKEIAGAMYVLPARIHERWRRIRAALGARGRAHAVAIALAVGLIEAPEQAAMVARRLKKDGAGASAA